MSKTETVKPKRNWLNSGLVWTLFLFYFCSLETITMLQNMSVDKIFVLGRYFSYLLLAIYSFLSIAGTKPKRMLPNLWEFIKTHWFLILFGIVSLGSTIVPKGITTVLIFLLMVAVHKMDNKLLFKISLYSMLALFIFISALSLIGLVPDLEFIRDGQRRVSFGFIYPLECHSLFFFIILMYMFVSYDHMSWKQPLLALAGNFVLYYFTRARFSMVLICLTVVVFYGCRLMRQAKLRRIMKKPWFKFLALLFVVLMFVLPIIGSLFYDKSSEFWRFMNTLFNDRLQLANLAFKRFSLTPFGTYIEWVGLGGFESVSDMETIFDTYNYVDCSYIKNLFDYGYVYYIFIFGAYLWMMDRAVKTRSIPWMLAIAMVLLMSLYEARLMQVSMNAVLLSGAGFFFLSNEQIKNWFQQIRSDHEARSKAHKERRAARKAANLAEEQEDEARMLNQK